jgi:hypothetical protein
MAVDAAVIQMLAAELMNRGLYSRDLLVRAYRAYRGDPVAAVDTLNLPSIEEDD